MTQVLLLVRHAQTDFRQDRLAGWTPGVHLSPEGRENAKRLAERLQPVRLVGLYSSPLERCVETADAIAEGRRVQIGIEEGVGEVRFGRWQGRAYKVLAKTDLWRRVQFTPSLAGPFPGGETIRDLQARAVTATESIRGRHRRGAVAVVSHADTIKALTAFYLGLPLDQYQRLAIQPASVTAFMFAGAFPRLIRLSDTGALDDLAELVRPRKRPAAGHSEGLAGGSAK